VPYTSESGQARPVPKAVTHPRDSNIRENRTEQNHFFLKRHPHQCCVSLLHTTGTCPSSRSGFRPDRETFANEKFGGIFKPQPASSFVCASAPVLPVRAWCDPRSLLPHLHLASETSGPGLWLAAVLDSLGRVSAEIVCDDTLVQYAAYLALLLFGGVDGIIRFRSFRWGWRFFFFPPGQFLLFPCFGVPEKSFFCRPC
jgi:hypothetical protein